MSVQTEKDGWIFGTEKRTADKSFQLTDEDKLSIHIEAKWSTLRDWIEASYILNGKVIGTSKYSTITYAIRESENQIFLNDLTTTLNFKKSRKENKNNFSPYEFKLSCYGDVLSLNLGSIKAFINVHGEGYQNKDFKYKILCNLPRQAGWKTSQPKLPNLDDNGVSQPFDSLDNAKKACVKYIENLFSNFNIN